MANEESQIEAGSGEGGFYEKVRRCMRGRSHDWTEGPFAHPGKKARRCNPQRYEYLRTTCMDFRKREFLERRCVQVWLWWMPATAQEATTRDQSTRHHEGLPRGSAPESYDRASRYEDLSYDGPSGRDGLSQSSEHWSSAHWSAGICNVTTGDAAISGVVSKAALTDASGVGTNVACGSLAKIEDGAHIDSVKDDPNGRRAGGAAGGEQAKT
uniref:AtC3H23-like CCCH zinc finger domain-containing protein n=1 Tax=Physcomitrium patens TaxID=3218 RepID=A0A2K1KLF5_PHYPA|nr:hypothetical protein PHYPA_008287 [Physcomitrium patens]